MEKIVEVESKLYSFYENEKAKMLDNELLRVFSQQSQRHKQ
jgi:hypothetical protein